MLAIPPFDSRPHLDQLFLLLNLVLLLPLVAVVAWRLVQVWAERRRGLAGSRLHIRLVVLFSLVAVIPTIIVAVFSYLFFSFGVQAWFSDRVRTALSAIARRRRGLSARAPAGDPRRRRQHGQRSQPRCRPLDHQPGASQRDRSTPRRRCARLTEAMVFDGTGRMLARTGLTFALGLQPPPDWAMQQARAGDVAVMTSDNDDRVRALVKLERFGDVFLYVGRFVDPTVLARIEQTQSAVAQYEQLEGQRSEYQIAFSMAVLRRRRLLLLTGAVWVGLTFATRLARPISALIAAAERVRGGDLAARVPVRRRGRGVRLAVPRLQPHDQPARDPADAS